MPMYLMEKMFLVKYRVKRSPLYWTNKCLSILYNDIADDTTGNCLLVITTLSVVLIVVVNSFRIFTRSKDYIAMVVVVPIVLSI